MERRLSRAPRVKAPSGQGRPLALTRGRGTGGTHRGALGSAPVGDGAARQGAKRRAHGMVQAGVKLTMESRSGERWRGCGTTRSGGADGRGSPWHLHGKEEDGVSVGIG